MAVNHYFQGGKGIGNDAEKRLHEDLIIEEQRYMARYLLSSSYTC